MKWNPIIAIVGSAAALLVPMSCSRHEGTVGAKTDGYDKFEHGVVLAKGQKLINAVPAEGGEVLLWTRPRRADEKVESYDIYLLSPRNGRTTTQLTITEKE